MLSTDYHNVYSKGFAPDRSAPDQHTAGYGQVLHETFLPGPSLPGGGVLIWKTFHPSETSYLRPKTYMGI